MNTLTDSDVKFIEAAKRARQRPFDWWWSAVPVGIVAFMLVSLSFILCIKFRSRGLEFVICTFYQGKYRPAGIKLETLCAFVFCTHALLSAFIFFYASVARKVRVASAAYEVIRTVAGQTQISLPRAPGPLKTGN